MCTCGVVEMMIEPVKFCFDLTLKPSSGKNQLWTGVRLAHAMGIQHA
jgi:hypothetical protein